MTSADSISNGKKRKQWLMMALGLSLGIVCAAIIVMELFGIHLFAESAPLIEPAHDLSGGGDLAPQLFEWIKKPFVALGQFFPRI